MRFLAAIVAVLAAYYLGTTKVPQYQLEGTHWCFHGEYRSLKDYGSTHGVPDAMVDVQRDGVKVYERCLQP